MADSHEMSLRSVQPGFHKSEKAVKGAVDSSVAASILFPACLIQTVSVQSLPTPAHCTLLLCHMPSRSYLSPLASPSAFSPSPLGPSPHVHILDILQSA